MTYRSMLESKWGALVGLCFGYVGIALLILIDVVRSTVQPTIPDKGKFGQRIIPVGERE